MDDEYSMEHETNPAASTTREIVMSGGSKISCRAKQPGQSYESPNTLERVIIAGQPRAPQKVS